VYPCQRKKRRKSRLDGKGPKLFEFDSQNFPGQGESVSQSESDGISCPRTKRTERAGFTFDTYTHMWQPANSAWPKPGHTGFGPGLTAEMGQKVGTAGLMNYVRTESSPVSDWPHKSNDFSINFCNSHLCCLFFTSSWGLNFSRKKKSGKSLPGNQVK